MVSLRLTIAVTISVTFEFRAVFTEVTNHRARYSEKTQNYVIYINKTVKETHIKGEGDY